MAHALPAEKFSLAVAFGGLLRCFPSRSRLLGLRSAEMLFLSVATNFGPAETLSLAVRPSGLRPAEMLSLAGAWLPAEMLSLAVARAVTCRDVFPRGSMRGQEWTTTWTTSGRWQVTLGNAYTSTWLAG